MASRFVAVPGNAEVSEATRHMCVGVYVDESFALQVQDQMDMQDFRAVPPCYGVDLGLLRRHAERARILKGARDLKICGSLLVVLVTVPLAAVLIVVYMKVWGLLAGAVARGGRRMVRVPGMHSWYRTRFGTLRVEPPGEELWKALKSCLPLAVISFFMLPLLTYTSYLPSGLVVVDMLVFLIVFPWLAGWSQQQKVFEELRRLGPAWRLGSGPPPENVVIYSGFRPFVGSGMEIRSWALDLRLTPARDTGGTPAATTRFGTGEMLSTLRTGLSELQHGPATAPSVTVWEQLFVSGQDLLDGPAPFSADAFLGGSVPFAFRPVNNVRPEVVEAARGRTEGPVRHCLTTQVRSWDLNVVLTVHVQAAVTEHTVHLYSTAAVLPPVREAYRQVDRMTEAHGSEHRLRVVACGWHAAMDSLAQPVKRAVQYAFRRSLLERQRQRFQEAIRYDRRYDFGAGLSLRELAATADYSNYFQRIDVRRYESQIQLRMLTVLKALFEKHGWDTSELDEGRQMILNNGVIMTGGAMHGAVAAGIGAVATSQGGSGGPLHNLARQSGSGQGPGSGGPAAPAG